MKVTITKKYNDLGISEKYQLINAILSDELSVKRSMIREIMKCSILLQNFTDLDFSDFTNDNGIVVAEVLYDYVTKETDLYEQFLKLFPKKEIKEIDNQIYVMRQEILDELKDNRLDYFENRLTQLETKFITDFSIQEKIVDTLNTIQSVASNIDVSTLESLVNEFKGSLDGISSMDNASLLKPLLEQLSNKDSK